MQEPTPPTPTVVVDDTQKPKALEVKPKSSCRHCLGRGYEGTDINTGKKVICRCVKRNYLKANASARLDDALKAAADAEKAKLAPAVVTPQSGWDDAMAVSSAMANAGQTVVAVGK